MQRMCSQHGLQAAVQTASRRARVACTAVSCKQAAASLQGGAHALDGVAVLLVVQARVPELPHDDAETVHVARLHHPPRLQHLGRHVAFRPVLDAADVPLAPLDLHAEAEIGDFADPAALVGAGSGEQDVVRLQVAVDDVVLVDGLAALGDVEAEEGNVERARGAVPLQRAVADGLLQVACTPTESLFEHALLATRV